MELSRPVKWVKTEEVKKGDILAFLLSDSQEYAEVTGWTDAELSNVPGKPVHRTFRVKNAPWWVVFDEIMTTGTIGGNTLIVDKDRETT